MPFLRFSRDKRGYENYYLVQPVTGRRGKPPQHRILYWFRTPPSVKVGREPFDGPMQRAIEAQNPGVEFDWETIRNTPFPPVQVEPIWRERRRAEKAAKLLQQQEDAAERGEAPAVTESAGDGAAGPASIVSPAPDAERIEESVSAADVVPSPDVPSAPAAELGPGPGHRRRRRRRRGRRGGPGDARAAVPGQTESGAGSSMDSEAVSSDLSPEDPDEAPGE